MWKPVKGHMGWWRSDEINFIRYSFFRPKDGKQSAILIDKGKVKCHCGPWKYTIYGAGMSEPSMISGRRFAAQLNGAETFNEALKKADEYINQGL